MLPDIEARYLALEWLERGRARNIEVTPDALDIEIDLEGTLRIETQIFHDFHPWLGLRLNGSLHKSTPVLVDAYGREHPMLAVDDGAGSIWWVQDSGWDAVHQRHLSELHRTMGQFEVRISDQRLLIDNRITGLGQAQLHEYQQDFKHDLIWLVLSSGTATTTGAGSFFGSELTAALSEFSSAASRVGIHPAKVLREISAETRRSRLRPNAASFRQHAREPARRSLIGRASEETANTADNRYLRHMVQICHQLSMSTSLAAQQHADRFSERASFEDDRSEIYNSMRSRQVDPDVFDHQLAELTAKLDRLAAWSDTAPDDQKISNRDYPIEIGKRYGKRGDEFFFQKPEGESEFDREQRIDYNVIRLPEELCERMMAAHRICKRYTLTGKPSVTQGESSTGKRFRQVIFSKVIAVRPDRHVVVAKQRKRERLEKNQWQQALSGVERDEMRRESRTAALRAETYRNVAEQANAAAIELSACQSALRQQDALWQALGVLPQSTFPMGMRYTMSPDYAAVLKAFTRVRELARLSGIGNESLDDLNRISVLHASALYERWCMVKIIGVLMEDFGFEPNPGWQELVIRGATGQPDSIRLQFHRNDIGVSAILDIQPVLENGRRPDFRLRFNAAGSREVATIVMDAKFRTSWRQGELTELLADLVNSKGYGGEKDRVFILQPQANSILVPSSPLTWGPHCDFGQDAPSNHRTGSIQLATGTKGRGTQNNLRRLFAMGLQAVFPVPKSPPDEDRASSSCCVRCGTRHEPDAIQQKTTDRGKRYWTLGCAHCGMLSVRTHCYDCSEPLFKNGTDLTYHRTLADQITNIVCPSCGAYFDRDLRDN